MRIELVISIVKDTNYDTEMSKIDPKLSTSPLLRLTKIRHSNISNLINANLVD